MALGLTAAVQLAAALAIDTALRACGVDLHPWRDAVGTVLCALPLTICVPLVSWRMGLITLRQYLAGGFAITAPVLTLVFVMLIAADHALIAPAWLPRQEIPPDIARTAYFRLIRAAVLVPIWLTAFHWAYHIHLQMIPQGHEKAS